MVLVRTVPIDEGRGTGDEGRYGIYFNWATGDVVNDQIDLVFRPSSLVHRPSQAGVIPGWIGTYQEHEFR